MIVPLYFDDRTTPRQNAMVGAFVNRIVFDKPDAIRDFCSMAVHDGKDLIAGTLFHNLHRQEGVIELTSGSLSKRWLTKPVIRAMFTLPFDILGCQLAVLRVSERNTSMVRIARSFGFGEVYIPRLRGRDEGEFIFSYSDDQWRASPLREVCHR